MKISLSKVIFFSFLLLPLSFKIELKEGISFYPQELILPFALILVLIKKEVKIPKFTQPFIFYIIALTIVLCSTLVSQLSVIDLSSLLKTVKYLIYLLAILILSNYSFKEFVPRFNKIAFISISTTILLFAYKIIVFEGTFAEFIHLTTWNVRYTPSGLSNLNFNIQDLEFVRTTGNHGIYGSYLILVYIINVSEIIRKESFKKFNILLVGLTLLNLFILNSRESLLLFIVVNALYFVKPLLKLRLKLTYLYLSLLFLGVVSLLLAFDINIGLIQKLNHTISSFSEHGQESNISLRFGVWNLILLSFILYPGFLFVGYGYNIPHFTEYLTETNKYYQLYDVFITVPESVFFFFLAFGGIIALFFILLFFISIGIDTFKISKKSIIAELLFFYIIGLFFTNNTGGSIMSDLLLAQFALVYFWVHKSHRTGESIVYNC